MKHMWRRLAVMLVAMGWLILAGTPATAAKGGDVKSVVKDASKQAVAQVSVYLIPATDVAAMAKTAMEV